MKEIQRVNQFSGQDIFYMVELLIPYKGQQSLPQAKKQAEPERMERLRREGCIIMLNEAIMNAEEKMTKQNLIEKQKLGKTYR